VATHCAFCGSAEAVATTVGVGVAAPNASPRTTPFFRSNAEPKNKIKTTNPGTAHRAGIRRTNIPRILILLTKRKFPAALGCDPCSLRDIRRRASPQLILRA
jgi:hypothetical protein